MGYQVDMVLRNVKFTLKNLEAVKKELKDLNESWQKSRDWCRFDGNEEDLNVIFEEIGFETSRKDDFFHILEFERENLGDHETIFWRLRPFLEDCEILFYGEDDTDWKIVIKDQEFSKVMREEL